MVPVSVRPSERWTWSRKTLLPSAICSLMRARSRSEPRLPLRRRKARLAESSSYYARYKEKQFNIDSKDDIYLIDIPIVWLACDPDCSLSVDAVLHNYLLLKRWDVSDQAKAMYVGGKNVSVELEVVVSVAPTCGYQLTCSTSLTVSMMPDEHNGPRPCAFRASLY